MCVENSPDEVELTSELNLISWEGLNAAVNHLVVKVK
jgi:hypothetical protein